MRTGIVIATGLLALTAAIGARADQKEDQQKYCESLAAFQTDLAELNAISPQSTMADVRTVTDRIQDTAKDVKKAAGKINSPSSNQFEGAIDQLRNDVKGTPDNATVAQVQQKLRADVQKVQLAEQKLTAEAHCPAAQPSGQPSGQQVPQHGPQPLPQQQQQR